MKTAFKCFKFYRAMSLHLTSDYDFLSSAGRTRGSSRAWERRTDRLLFEQLSRMRDPYGYIFANLVLRPRAHPNDFTEEAYHRYRRVSAAPHESMRRDLKGLGDVRDAIRVVDGSSRLLNSYMSGQVELETLVMLERVYAVCRYWQSRLTGAWFLYEELFHVLRGYSVLMEVDDDKTERVVRESINRNGD